MKIIIYNKNLKNLARNLRKNMTKEEKHLWYDFLRNYSVRFVRQMPIGNYIADFYSPKAKLIIELDGSQHYDEQKKQSDTIRTEYFNRLNIDVLRFPNNEISGNFNGVCEYIDFYIKNKLG